MGKRYYAIKYGDSFLVFYLMRFLTMFMLNVITFVFKIVVILIINKSFTSEVYLFI